MPKTLVFGLGGGARGPERHSDGSGGGERDKATHTALEGAGWRVFVVWECQIKDRGALGRRIRNFLQ